MKALRERYQSRQITTVDIAKEVTRRIIDYQRFDPAVWTHLLSPEDLLRSATKLEDRFRHQPLPTLYGVPFAVKDNIDVAGVPTTNGCAENAYVPTKSAKVVSALLEAGALFIVKTNMDQLATGLSGCRSLSGYPRSIFDQNRVSGGSSSGSAVAVAANLVTFALGTDTAGSGRVPAAFNGVVGFKPTKCTLSTNGVVPACSSLDTISIFSPTVDQAREIWLNVDEGPDMSDPWAKSFVMLGPYRVGLWERSRAAVLCALAVRPAWPHGKHGESWGNQAGNAPWREGDDRYLEAPRWPLWL